MGVNRHAHSCLYYRIGWKHSSVCGCVSQSFYEDGDELFHCKLGGGGFYGDPVLPAADGPVGRHRNLVPGTSSLQDTALLSGKILRFQRRLSL